jgi:hypothetical protein
MPAIETGAKTRLNLTMRPLMDESYQPAAGCQ